MKTVVAGAYEGKEVEMVASECELGRRVRDSRREETRVD